MRDLLIYFLRGKMKRIFMLLLFGALVCTSCRVQQSEDRVTVNYLLKEKIVLDMEGDHLEPLLQAMETASAPFVVQGRVVNARPANEENLNGYSISVQKRDGRRAFHSLHNNFPFSISSGNTSIYNFKHLLSEKDIRLLYELIPAWREDKNQ